MNILLVGFTTQNAAALTMLINRNYPAYQVQTLERTFCENLRLCLPSLNAIHQDAVAMIINLDGVGMIRYNDNAKGQLQEFVGHRAAAFVVRSDFDEWRQSQVVSRGRGIFIKAPYDRETVNLALAELFAVIPAIKPATPSPNSASVSMARAGMTSSPATNRPSMPSANLRTVLEEYFDESHHHLIENLLPLSMSASPISVKVGGQMFFVNRLKNVALVHDKARLVSYCESLQQFQSLKQVFVTDRVRQDEFDSLFLDKSYQKYALDSLLWQLYDVLLPHHIKAARSDLSLKLKYMPNLTGLSITETEKEVLWLCLAYKKDLNTLLAAYQNKISEDELSRLILILLMSGVADSDILSTHQVLSKAQATPQNEGVRRAKSSGFLDRLLKVLNADVGEILTTDVGDLVARR